VVQGGVMVILIVHNIDTTSHSFVLVKDKVEPRLAGLQDIENTDRKSQSH